MKINRLLPLLIPLVDLILFEVFLYNPKMIYVILVIVNLRLFFTINQFTKGSKVSSEWWNFLILPVLFTTSLAAYSTLITDSVLIRYEYLVQFLFIANTVFLYYYLRTIYQYLIQPESYREFSLENISSYGNFITFYFVSTVVYGLQSFLNIPIWPLMVIVAIVSILIVYQVLWINKISIGLAFIYIVVASMVLVELAWSISFLPLNFNISGLVLAICYYMLIGTIRHRLLETLDKRTVELYLFFGFGSIIMLLITARWM